MALQNDSLIVRFRASASRIQGNEFAIQLYPLTNVSRGPCNVLIGSLYVHGPVFTTVLLFCPSTFKLFPHIFPETQS